MNDMVSRPYVALLIAGDVAKEDCEAKLKKISIRKGYRDYRTGDTLLLCCHLSCWAGPIARVTEVRHTIAEFITDKECTDDGFENWDDMVEGLKEYYPDFAEQTPVTVIRWEYQ